MGRDGEGSMRGSKCERNGEREGQGSVDEGDGGAKGQWERVGQGDMR
jgi:hypothetical protein